MRRRCFCSIPRPSLRCLPTPSCARGERRDGTSAAVPALLERRLRVRRRPSRPPLRRPGAPGPDEAPTKKRTIALALGLLFAGSVLLGCYALWFTGYLPLPNDEEQGTSTALLVLGCITFAPGLYVSAILAGAALGVPGVNYSMIPE